MKNLHVARREQRGQEVVGSMTGMEIAIVVVSILFVVVLVIAIAFKATLMAKQARRFNEEIRQIRESDKYLLDIVQNGKVVRIECRDVNAEVVGAKKEG